MYYRIFQTEYGYVSIVTSEKGLTAVSLPVPSDRGLPRLPANKAQGAVRSDELLPDLVDELRRYFRGEKIEFSVDPDLSEATDFQRRVWAAARTIPYGETRSYGWVAAKAGNPSASRAVGNAMGKNPVPIIVPCHRVIAGDGSIGGFSSGLDMKKKLLSLEGLTQYR